MSGPGASKRSRDARSRFVRRFWATHQDSPIVRSTLAGLLAALGEQDIGLNVGCGDVRLNRRLVNLDRYRMPTLDCLADAAALPFAAGTFALVVSQETIEHLPDPFRAVREMARVVLPGGRLYLQAPFVIGYHPGPEDYWRFTKAGMQRLLQSAGLHIEQVRPALGAGTGLHRILVEFLAGSVAAAFPAAYFPVKALAAALFYPLKWLDRWTLRGSQSDRIPGGYIAIGRKIA